MILIFSTPLSAPGASIEQKALLVRTPAPGGLAHVLGSAALAQVVLFVTKPRRLPFFLPLDLMS
jgi:hypothetical protein